MLNFKKVYSYYEQTIYGTNEWKKDFSVIENTQ